MIIETCLTRRATGIIDIEDNVVSITKYLRISVPIVILQLQHVSLCGYISDKLMYHSNSFPPQFAVNEYRTRQRLLVDYPNRDSLDRLMCSSIGVKSTRRHRDSWVLKFLGPFITTHEHIPVYHMYLICREKDRNNMPVSICQTESLTKCHLNLILIQYLSKPRILCKPIATSVGNDDKQVRE